MKPIHITKEEYDELVKDLRQQSTQTTITDEDYNELMKREEKYEGKMTCVIQPNTRELLKLAKTVNYGKFEWA